MSNSTNHSPSHAKPLTRNQEMVFDLLQNTSEPQSAYELLDALRTQGIRAPLQIYRALDKLVEMGLAHRLESLNAFVACRHEDNCNGEDAIFTICSKCGAVSEISDCTLFEKLSKLVAETGFCVRHATVELRGNCRECA